MDWSLKNLTRRDIIYAFVVVAIIILIFVSYKLWYMEDLLVGFWTCDDEFCAIAELDWFYLFIGPKKFLSPYRDCYILAQQEGVLTINQSISMSIGFSIVHPRNWKSVDKIDSKLIGSIYIKGLDESIARYFPVSQSIEFYPNISKLIFFKGKNAYAEFYKNSKTTEEICPTGKISGMPLQIEDTADICDVEEEASEEI
jgi:hypothetical protein